MATDGVKIIEGDLAYDLYAHFTEMYNLGAGIEQLQEQFAHDKKECSFDKFDYEICVTVYALAFWEIGALTQDMLNEVKAVIAEKSTVSRWSEVDEEAGIERQEELDKFIEKISTPNPKPQKRKRYKKVETLFKKGDVLSFQYPDKTYGAAFVVDIDKMGGFCFYSICRTKYVSRQVPTMEDFIQKATFIASKVPSGISNTEDGMVLLIWVNYIDHEDLVTFVSCFDKIGSIDFQLEFGQTLITKDYQGFCDNSHLEGSIDYTVNKVGQHAGEYPVKEYIR